MARIAKFLRDESGTGESTSTLIMIAAAGLLLALGLMIWFGKINTFFSGAGSFVKEAGESRLKLN